VTRIILTVKRWVVASLLAIALFGGCTPAERSTAPLVVDDESPHRGGTLLRRLEQDVTSLNPVLATSRYDRLVADYLFTPLINYDDELHIVSGLAESWTVSPDGRDYTFKLNPNATFSDRTPVRASDVLFTLRKIIDPQSESVQIASGFETMDLTRSKVVDDHTVTVAFREALASQLSQFNAVMVLPEHIYGRGNFKNDFNLEAAGSGPYRLIRRVPGKEVVLQRRGDYWGPEPFIDTILFKVLTNETTAWNALQRGDVDETMMNSDVWMRSRTAPALLKHLDFRQFYGLAYNYIAWNERNPLFSDKRVRRALSMSLDVPSIIKNLYGGTARAVNGHFMPDQWAYNPEVPVIPYDPTAAKQIFTSLGWLDTNGDGVIDKDGKPFKFDLTILAGSQQALSIGQLFQATLKTIGVDCQLAVIDSATGIQRILAGNYEAAYLSWDLDPDPDPFAIFHSSQAPPRGQNLVSYSNPQADKLIEMARREMDMGKRAQYYKQLQVILADDQPYTWVNQPSVKWAVNRRVRGVKDGKGFGLFVWYPGELDWWIAGAKSTLRPQTSG
jgi:peptide/nickel transport system substrate-binding protein